MKYELILSYKDYLRQPLYTFSHLYGSSMSTAHHVAEKEFSVLACVLIAESSKTIFKITFGDQESMLKFQLKYL